MIPDWQPSADQSQRRRRAHMLATIRYYFAEQDVLEVETPLLAHATGTDPQLDFFISHWQDGQTALPMYLQTSPEFAMKRLLAAGSGSIYQIAKAFRQGERGRFHNPEFTLIEWYRIGFDLGQLMEDVERLLLRLLPGIAVQRCEYRSLFLQHTGLDPLAFERSRYRQQASALGYAEADALCTDDHAVWLDFLFSHAVQPKLCHWQIDLVYGYPAVLSSLARLNPDDARVAQRVEVFVNGVELGNGYHELTDPLEQHQRFEREIRYRQQHGLPSVDYDRRLLAALQHGLPDCSGIAIGLDRLLMIASDAEQIDAVLNFPIDRA